MTTGKRRAIVATADMCRDLTRSDLERAFVLKRSTTSPEVIAALVETDVDVDEITRVARGVLSGERRAVARFLEFASERVNSLALVLCLAGDDHCLAQGLDMLRAQAQLMPRRKLPMTQRLLLADALILRGMYGEAAAWLSVAGFEGTQHTRYVLSIFNPFRQNNTQGMTTHEWVAHFNEIMSPSGALAKIELDDARSVVPFERLSAPCVRRVEGPLVTIIMSSFRPDESIFGSIRSILNQTWRSLELLVVDDASGAEYDGIYQRVARMDTRIRLVRQRVNGGTYLIRNKSISLARGAFIGFQDNDDWSHPERIERQMEPMLRDSSIVSTQSLCFRTDEHLDPVRIGYRKHLRRNESSLIFRAEVVRRIGFFHYTRKGGDSEYRLRLEAAFGRPTTVVGEEALAIIRLTPGSLSRNEFSAGFRHPSRIVYTEGYNLVHARAEQEGSYYRSHREYREPFVPAKFQPRPRATESERIDVVIAADLRASTPGGDWAIATCVALSRRGLRVGLAHYVGFRFDGRISDRLAPDVAGLFVDGIAAPVDFSEKRTIDTVVVADAALLQHAPWQQAPWSVKRVFARRLVADWSADMYDDATAGFTSLQLFGVRPTWVGPGSDARTLRELMRTNEDSTVPSPLVDDFDTFVSSTTASSRPSTTSWHCSVMASPISDRESGVDELVRVPAGVPHTASLSRVDDRWCVVIGWPSFGFEGFAEPACASRVLLHAWLRSRSEFERQYADLGGFCVVIRGEGHDVAVRSTSASLMVRREGDTIRLSNPGSASDAHLLDGGNLDELVLPRDGLADLTPIATPITHDGTPSAELQHMVQWELRRYAGRRIRVILDDDEESALVLGLLRESVEDVDFVVRHATSHIAKFLQSRFVGFRIVSSHLANDEADYGAGGVAPLEPRSALTAFATSYRFRRLLEVALSASTSGVELDALWTGLSTIPRGQSRTTRGSSHTSSRAMESKLPILRGLVPEDSTGDEFIPGENRTLRILPDLARNEKYPLSALMRRGSTDRLIVSLSSGCGTDELGFPIPPADETNTADHLLVLADTTCADVSRVGYGWFFGSENDNLILRYVQLVREMAAHIDCSEVIVSGHGCTALPAVLLASLLRNATALISDPEAIAGEADGEQFEWLVESLASDAGLEEFVEANAHRLRMRDVLAAAPPDLRLVVVRDDVGKAVPGSSVVEADPRTVVVDESPNEWLSATV